MNNQYSTPANTLILLGRVLASVLFILSGFGKFMAPEFYQAYFANIGVPIPFLAYIVAVCVELGGGILFLLGVQTRVIAAVLAAFTVATALLAHSDFSQLAQQINFMKNLAIAGGFLGFAVLGGGEYSVDGQMARPGRKQRLTARLSG